MKGGTAGTLASALLGNFEVSFARIEDPVGLTALNAVAAIPISFLKISCRK